MRGWSKEQRAIHGYEGDLPVRPMWNDEASCRGRTDWFAVEVRKGDSAERNPEVQARILVCLSCPVRVQCANDALDQGSRLAVGVWAGVWAGSNGTSARTRLAIVAGGAVPPAPPKIGRPPAPPGHGTENGYRGHIRQGTVTCAPCRAAHAQHVALFKRKKVS